MQSIAASLKPNNNKKQQQYRPHRCQVQLIEAHGISLTGTCGTGESSRVAGQELDIAQLASSVVPGASLSLVVANNIPRRDIYRSHRVRAGTSRACRTIQSARPLVRAQVDSRTCVCMFQRAFTFSCRLSECLCARCALWCHTKFIVYTGQKQNSSSATGKMGNS